MIDPPLFAYGDEEPDIQELVDTYIAWVVPQNLTLEALRNLLTTFWVLGKED